MTLSHLGSKLKCAFIFVTFISDFSMNVKMCEINIQILLKSSIFVIFLFLCFFFFFCLFSKLVKYQISKTAFARYTLGFIFVLSLIDHILGLDSMPYNVTIFSKKIFYTIVC